MIHFVCKKPADSTWCGKGLTLTGRVLPPGDRMVKYPNDLVDCPPCLELKPRMDEITAENKAKRRRVS